MEASLTNDWQALLKPEFEQEYFQQLCIFLDNEYRDKTIYPPREDIYNALHITDYQSTQVLLLGQDPYHGSGQAHGLSFSVRKDMKIPPSLRNIYKELQSDLHIPIPSHGNLTTWAESGVLLLNTLLTVEAGKANSHRHRGWEKLTDTIIQLVSMKETPVVFVLWGAHAKSKKRLIDSRHLIIESVHPSPLSAYGGFWGSKPFSTTNEFLISHQKEPICWQIID